MGVLTLEVGQQCLKLELECLQEIVMLYRTLVTKPHGPSSR